MCHQVKSKEKEVPLPVLVWLHGGSFVLGGAAAMDERFIMDRDLVLVIPQYRLGLLGEDDNVFFLYHLFFPSYQPFFIIWARMMVLCIKYYHCISFDIFI